MAKQISYHDFKTDKDFKSWLRKHNMLMRHFFEKYHPIYDPLTKEKILFENKTQYFEEQKFKTKKNMAIWLSKQPISDAQDFILNQLEYRKNKKKLKKFPCHLETRICNYIPSLNHILKYFDYQEIQKRIKLKAFLNNLSNLELKRNPDFFVLMDTREQNPLNLDTEIVESKLEFGDYTAGGEHFNGVFIERKSLEDLCGTLSRGFERFQKEIVRAKSLDSYIVVLIESSYSDFENLEKEKIGKFSKVTFEFIGSRISKIMQENDNIQFLFVRNRKESEKYLLKILQSENVRSSDLQYMYDLKKI